MFDLDKEAQDELAKKSFDRRFESWSKQYAQDETSKTALRAIAEFWFQAGCEFTKHMASESLQKMSDNIAPRRDW